MNKKLLMAVILLMTITLFGCSTNTAPITSSNKIIPIVQTQDIKYHSGFQFTISPNGKWMIYLKSEPEKLVILNLLDFKKSELELTETEFVEFSLNANECWTKDSRYCVFPSLALNYKTIGPHPTLIVDINEGNDPKVIRQTSWNLTQQKIRYADLQPDELFTCSDCVSSAIKKNERYLMQQYVGSYLHFSPDYDGANHESFNIISHDKNKIYFQKERRTKEATLYEFDVSKQNEKKLVSFSSFLRGCANIERLRLSHDQKYLAMQVSYGCSFVTSPELYIFDLEKGESVSVAKNVYYDVHWNSQSQRLYFYKCDVGGGCGGKNDHIYFFEVG